MCRRPSPGDRLRLPRYMPWEELLAQLVLSSAYRLVLLDQAVQRIFGLRLNFATVVFGAIGFSEYLFHSPVLLLVLISSFSHHENMCHGSALFVGCCNEHRLLEIASYRISLIGILVLSNGHPCARWSQEIAILFPVKRHQ